MGLEAKKLTLLHEKNKGVGQHSLISAFVTVKPVLSSHSKINKTKVVNTNGSLMGGRKYCRMPSWSILQNF